MTSGPSRRLRRTFLAALLLATTTLAAGPSLVVVISIDQFRYDYLERFRPWFGPDGFNRLLEHGTVFSDCHFRHSYTKTGPGHAVMLTGVHANHHGIIANDWLDHATLARVSCVGDTTVAIVGLPPPSGPRPLGINDPYLGRSPRNLLVTTVGDELKLARGGRPKVIGISNKDRAAILMSGKMADAAYFMEDGRMVSSTYYMAELPAWVREWNAAGKVDAYFGRRWERILPADAYAVQGPDDAPGEDAGAAELGRLLPKMITGGLTAPGPKFHDAFENTPFSSEVLLDFVETAIAQEHLGGREGITDLLCVGLSANDHVGHLYGPDSHEVMDMVVRTDRLLAEYFRFLDRQIGRDKCLLVLTADHGAPPLPERIHELNPNVPAGRINGQSLVAAGEQALNRAYGPLATGHDWLVRDDASLLLLPAALRDRKVSAIAAQRVVRDAVLALDWVQAAYTRDELEREDVHDDLGRQAVLSFNRARSGDVFVQSRPYFFSRSTGTNHGTPYNYDTHVPLLWYGAGVPAGRHVERVGVDDLAPTLAHLLGLPAPPLARGQILFEPVRP